MENRQRRIEEIAYRLWELAGRPHGESDRFWHAAVEEYETERRRLATVAKELSSGTEAAAPRKAAAAKPTSKASETKAPAKPEPKEAAKPKAAKPKAAEPAPAPAKKAESEPVAKPKAAAKRKP